MKQLTSDQHIQLRKWIYEGDYTKRSNVFFAFAKLHDGNFTEALKFLEKAIGDKPKEMEQTIKLDGEGTIWAKG